MRHVVGEHRRRVAVIALSFLTFSLTLALLFVIPSFIVVYSAAQGYDKQLTATKTLVDLERKQGGGDTISDIGERAGLLSQALSRRTAVSILREIAPRIPSGITIRNFSYLYTGDGVTATLHGTARTRDALVFFGDALRSSPLFSRVEVPISSLAKSTDIDFTLSLSLGETEPGAPAHAPDVSAGFVPDASAATSAVPLP
jgi:hypothetical protein